MLHEHRYRDPVPLPSLRTELAIRVALLLVFVAIAGAIGMSIGGLALFALALPAALVAGVGALAFWRRGHRKATLAACGFAVAAAAGTVAGFVQAIG